MSLFPFRKKDEPLTGTEAFVLRQFPAAVALAAEEWRGYDGHFQHVDPDWRSKYTLSQRYNGFVQGPISTLLAERFPEIAAMGADADEKTNQTGSKDVILQIIIGEGIVASGTDSRQDVRPLRGQDPKP
jgi:hypothetical protein